MSLTAILNILKETPKIVAEAPAFKALFDQLLTVFNPKDQATLKSAYDEARQRSDAAEEDFVKASRGN